jgi:hypothetical protein
LFAILLFKNCDAYQNRPIKSNLTGAVCRHVKLSLLSNKPCNSYKTADKKFCDMIFFYLNTSKGPEKVLLCVVVFSLTPFNVSSIFGHSRDLYCELPKQEQTFVVHNNITFSKDRRG